MKNGFGGSLAIQWFVSQLFAFMLLGPAHVAAQTMCSGGTGTACVLTWQNDNWRTGQNLDETSITYQSFGGWPTFAFCAKVVSETSRRDQPICEINSYASAEM
jgi:hypothetical protein